MFFAMSMLMSGVNNASLSLHSIYYEDARINVVTCLEDMFYRIKKEEQFAGSLDYEISEDNTCSAEITWQAETPIKTGLTERLAGISIIGISHSFVREFEYNIRVGKYDVNHTDGSLEHMNTIDITSEEEVI